MGTSGPGEKTKGKGLYVHRPVTMQMRERAHGGGGAREGWGVHTFFPCIHVFVFTATFEVWKINVGL